jgi:hypothetical protein
MAPEKTPKLRERPLGKKAREELLFGLPEHAQKLRSELNYNRPDLVPYSELITIMHVLTIRAESLKPPTEIHLKKMASLARRVGPKITKRPGDYKFWELLETSTEIQWTKVQSFSEDLSDMPKSWQGALDDLRQLEQSVTEEPEQK